MDMAFMLPCSSLPQLPPVEPSTTDAPASSLAAMITRLDSRISRMETVVAAAVARLASRAEAPPPFIPPPTPPHVAGLSSSTPATPPRPAPPPDAPSAHPASSSSSYCSCSSARPAQAGPARTGGPPPPLLQVEGLKTKWFAVSPHPDFLVTLAGDARVGAAPRTLHIAASNALGQLDEGILEPDATAFPIVDGQATVTGLRFRKVSSQNGGWFVLHFSVAGVPGMTATSERLNVRCQRMKCEGKADGEEDLLADDDIGRIPGIGKGYAKRWRALGFNTVADLAKIDIAPSARAGRMELLGQLRKGRGALTEARMSDLLRLARRVVDKQRPAGGPAAALAALASPAPLGPFHHAWPPAPALAGPASDLVAVVSTTTTTTTTATTATTALAAAEACGRAGPASLDATALMMSDEELAGLINYNSVHMED